MFHSRNKIIYFLKLASPLLKWRYRSPYCIFIFSSSNL